MAHKKIIKLIGFLMLLSGFLYVSVASIAFMMIDVGAIIGMDIGILKTAIEIMRKDVVLNVLILIAGYYFCFWGYAMFSGKQKKALLDYRINYKVVSIETDDVKGTVKIDLKDTRTGDEVTVQKETKNLKYFREYINLNGDIMPGGIAAVV